jgi:hypothetical protein
MKQAYPQSFRRYHIDVPGLDPSQFGFTEEDGEWLPQITE